MNENNDWTKEQEETVGKMIKESEDIGYVQGYDDAIKEIVNKFEIFIFELKKMFFIGKDKKNENGRNK
jgi:hypothetical protein